MKAPSPLNCTQTWGRRQKSIRAALLPGSSPTRQQPGSTAHIHSTSLEEFIPHSHGVVFTNASNTISITSPSNPTTNIRRPYRMDWRREIKRCFQTNVGAATEFRNVSSLIFANLGISYKGKEGSRSYALNPRPSVLTIFIPAYLWLSAAHVHFWTVIIVRFLHLSSTCQSNSYSPN